MDTRIEISLIYINSINWIGGTYYVENLICAINTLEDKQKPLINVFCNGIENFKHLQDITNYPYLVFQNYSEKKNIVFRAINYFKYLLSPLHYKALGAIDASHTKSRLIYPVRYRTQVKQENIALAWIPDFQEKYYPQYFTPEQIKIRTNLHRSFIDNNIPIVFSSKDSENDFLKFYPDAKVKTHVLHFAVTHPTISCDDALLKKKFEITKPYLFCANQFWVHKNHKLLFEAFAAAKKKGLDLQLVCSGNMFDHRNSGYGDELNQILVKNNIEKDVILVGFLKREEQLCLMSNSYAVIQPSLFEGWSTVVEDAKALNKFIFLSNIRVHLEQNPKNVCYFEATNKDDLVDKLINTKVTNFESDYSSDIRAFGEKFISLTKEFGL